MASRLPGAQDDVSCREPMPRSDGGLELLTSDGELAVKLQRAARHVASEFSVRCAASSAKYNCRDLERVLIAARRSRWRAARARAARRQSLVLSHRARRSGKDVRQLFERQAALVSRGAAHAFWSSDTGAQYCARPISRAHARANPGAHRDG